MIVFAYEIIVTRFFNDQQSVAEIFSTYGVIPRFLLAGDVPSAISSMFVHGGIVHIAGNMIFLFVFGDNIEDRFGRIKYLVAYISWGIMAAVIHSVFAINFGGGGVPAVGASGAISGVLGAYLVMFPKAKIFTIIMAFFITTIRIPALAFIPFWFILQIVFALMGSSGGGIAYLAHIGGFIVGLATGYAWKILTVGKSRVMSMMNKPRIKQNELRPRIEDTRSDISPELIEGADFYEIIAEIRGVTDASKIQAIYEPGIRSMRIVATGTRNYDLLVKLPEKVVNPTIKYIRYLNGIVRIRLTK
jgi:membrane associated rhomboid family serine protease